LGTGFTFALGTGFTFALGTGFTFAFALAADLGTIFTLGESLRADVAFNVVSMGDDLDFRFALTFYLHPFPLAFWINISQKGQIRHS
jgi:hypothetical protein